MSNDKPMTEAEIDEVIGILAIGGTVPEVILLTALRQQRGEIERLDRIVRAAKRVDAVHWRQFHDSLTICDLHDLLHQPAAKADSHGEAGDG